MDRIKIVAGNWKMNRTYVEGRQLTLDVLEALKTLDVLVILCTPFIHLQNVKNIITDIANVKLGAQNCHQEASGAYTGEISAPMLKSVGVDYVIIGHSERREYFGEDDAILAKKVDVVLEHGMHPIFCCGESLDIREAGKHIEHVTTQVEKSLFHLDEEAIRKLTIAYEPVWAIGTGKTASPEQAQEMHKEIRSSLHTKYGDQIADRMPILYGGSVKPANAKELFSKPDVDGGLIGGASLKAADFNAIVESF